MFATTGLKPTGVGYNITTGASSAASSNPIAVGVRTIRLAATTASWVTIGPSPVATATTSIYLPANLPEYFQCSGNGADKVAALEFSGAGAVNVTEMTS